MEILSVIVGYPSNIQMERGENIFVIFLLLVFFHERNESKREGQIWIRR